MAKVKRLSRVARDCNVGINTIVEFLSKKGFEIDSSPNSKIPEDALDLVMNEFQQDQTAKREAEKFTQEHRHESRTSAASDESVEEEEAPVEEEPEQEEVLLITDKGIGKVEVIEVDKKEKERTEKEARKEPVEEVKKELKEEVRSEAKEGVPEEVEKAEEFKPKAKPESIVAHEGLKPETVISPKVKEDKAKDEEKKSTVPLSVKGKEELAKKEVTPEAKELEDFEAVKEEKAAEKVDKEVSPAQDKEIKEKVKEEEIFNPNAGKEVGAEIKVIGKIDIDSLNQKTRPTKKSKIKEAKTPESKTIEKEEAPAAKEAIVEEQKEAPEVIVVKKTPSAPETMKDYDEAGEVDIKTEIQKLSGPTVVGRIELPKVPVKKKQQPTASSDKPIAKKKKRKRIRKDKVNVEGEQQRGGGAKKEGSGQDSYKGKPKPGARGKRRIAKPEVSEEDVQKQIKDTLARLTTKGKSKGSKHRRDKRESIRQTAASEAEQKELNKAVIKVTEFVTANEMATMMNVHINEIIATCLNLGLFVSINQRLDAETIALVADEFGYEVEFVSVELQESIASEAEEENEEDLVERPPIITVMGHVDHGKTSLLDYIRKANVIAGEAGGITQHIGAYKVMLANDKTITFLDTPGHEAFTAMRARGAQVTDLAIIVVAADDAVMPQTVEAINHASAAGVPIVFAINKVDKDGAKPEKIKEQLASMNYLVEEWGGKYQSHDISAKHGKGIDALLEKVLLEAELLDLKANPDRAAIGSVIESELDKGRGFVTTVLVQSGTLKIGDIIIAGSYFGRVKAMFNERSKPIKTAGPSEPVVLLGLNGAAQAGDKFNVLSNEREAREIATKREQLQREQGIRTQKHITLDEIGRRIAIGNFQELNIIVKGDVDGSIEALADSLIKLSTDEIQVNIQHKAVGQISESDILLAAASDAIIIGFQVRPSLAARKLAEKEGVDVRLYSIIYDAINKIKDAMEGMLSPEIREEIIGTLEILETFKITNVGTIAGCMVKDGKITRASKVRVIREGIVIYDGDLGSLKRYKDEVKEVVTGLECGIKIANFNDLKAGDNIESYLTAEFKKKLTSK